MGAKFNIRVDLRETGWEGVDWLHLGQMGSCEYGDEPLGSREGREFHHLSDY